MEAIRIDDPQDERVAAYRDVRERDLVGRQGLFVAEGKVVLDAMLAAGRFPVESVLVLESRLPGLRPTLARLPAAASVMTASQAVMDAIAGFHIHRGILAIGRKGEPASVDSLVAGLDRHALVLVLVGISNHDNMGAIFRNAAAFGADAVLLDTACCDPFYRKAIRVSVGAVLRTRFAVVEDMPSGIARLESSGFQMLALSPAGRLDLRSVARGDRVALFLGTEGEGLPEWLLDRLQTVRITMAPGFDSLNVAAASAIALHALQ